MSIYDRATRNLGSIVGNQRPNLGPGTHNVPLASHKWVKQDSYAPFQSIAERGCCFGEGLHTPGPGAYEIEFVRYKPEGGASLAYTNKRFPSEPDLSEMGPSPNSYNIVKRSDWIKPRSFIPNSASKINRISTGVITYERVGDVPSIPRPNQAFGYAEEKGMLRRQDPPPIDSTLGPAYYIRAAPSETKTTKKYKGVHWSKLTGERTGFIKINDAPSPALYNPGTSLNAVQQAVMAGKKTELSVPRYHEVLEKTAIKNHVPGPNSYNLGSQFSRKSHVFNMHGLAVVHPGFNVKAERFGGEKFITPAPGSYEDPRVALNALNKITGAKKSPFGKTAARFNKDKRNTPGPGKYNMYGYGMANDSFRKAYFDSTIKGGFGSTSSRNPSIVKKDEYHLPGPSRYQPVKREESYKKHNTSNFTSNTNRIGKTVPKTQIENPAVGSYDVAQSYCRSHNKKSTAQPRTKQAYLRNASFTSAAKRAFKLSNTDYETPGPGAYDQHVPKKSALCSKILTGSKRFEQIMEDRPGPGSYKMSPLIESSVLKGTFNTTLMQPVKSKNNVDHLPTTTNKKPAIAIDVKC